MPLTSLSQLPDLGGRFLQVADQVRPQRQPYYTKNGLDFLRYVALGGSSGRAGLWLQLVLARSAYWQSDHATADLAAAVGADRFGTIDGTGSGLIPFVNFFGHSSGLAIVIAYAGTTEVSQWLSYGILFDQVVHSPLPGRVYDALGHIFDLTWPLVRGKINEFNSRADVIFVGHSLGGALADMSAHALLSERGYRPRGVFTYGAPRIGNKDYADAMANWLDRVVLDGDPITDIPPPIFRRGLMSGPIINLAGPPIPITYQHSNCCRTAIGADHKPVSDVAGPRYENVMSLSEINLAFSLDGLSTRHGSAAYDSALYPWLIGGMTETDWFAAVKAVSADRKVSTGY